MKPKKIEIYLWWKRRNDSCVLSYVCCLSSQCFPLGRGPLLSFNLCLLLIHSPLGTLMWGVWRKPSPQPCAGLKRKQLPWCTLCFSPDSTVATERRFPLGERALGAHLSKESDGWGFVSAAHMGNMSMDLLNAPLIQIIRIGCDVKLNTKKTDSFWSWQTNIFMGSKNIFTKVYVNQLCRGNCF